MTNSAVHTGMNIFRVGIRIFVVSDGVPPLGPRETTLTVEHLIWYLIRRLESSIQRILKMVLSTVLTAVSEH